MGEAARSLEDHHPLITQGRDTGNGFYVVARHYPCNEAEVTAIRMHPDERINKGGGAKRKNSDKSQMDELTVAKARQRARTQLRRKVLSMGGDRMLTLTFRENVTDIDEAWKVFKYFSKLMRWKYKDRWAYVCVPEYQKRGAVHFHLAISGFYWIPTVDRLWKKACGMRDGTADVTDPRKYGKNSWNPKRIAQYLSKYMTNSDTVDFNKRRFSSGGSIEVPAPQTGWLALGVPVIGTLDSLLRSMTGKQVCTVYEVEGFIGITYLST